MEILYPRCAGLDVHKETVAACVLTPGPNAEPNKEIPQFGTTTGELRRLRVDPGQCPAYQAGAGPQDRQGGLRLDRLVAAPQTAHGQLRARAQGAQVGNRLRKVLEDAYIKLDSVASDALGVSGRAMIQVFSRQ